MLQWKSRANTESPSLCYMCSHTVYLIQPFLRKAVQESICCESRSLILSLKILYLEPFSSSSYNVLLDWIWIRSRSPKLIVYFSYKTLVKISHYCIILATSRTLILLFQYLSLTIIEQKKNNMVDCQEGLCHFQCTFTPIIFWKIFLKKIFLKKSKM